MSGKAQLGNSAPAGRRTEGKKGLASDESRFITGAELKIDGGISAM
jgi:hypothetical protein